MKATSLFAALAVAAIAAPTAAQAQVKINGAGSSFSNIIYTD